MDAVHQIAYRHRVVHIDIFDVLTLRLHLFDDARDGAIIGDDPGITQRIAQGRDLRDDHRGVGQRGGNLFEQVVQPVRRAAEVVVLDDIVTADMQQDDLWLIGLEPGDDMRGDLVDAPAWMPFVIPVWQTGGAIVLRADKDDVIMVGHTIVPQRDAISSPVGGADARRNGIAEGHDPDHAGDHFVMRYRRLRVSEQIDNNECAEYHGHDHEKDDHQVDAMAVRFH